MHIGSLQCAFMTTDESSVNIIIIMNLNKHITARRILNKHIITVLEHCQGVAYASPPSFYWL